MEKSEVPNSFHRTAAWAWHIVLVALLLSLTGCASRELPPEPPAAVYVSPSTWRQVDFDIESASRTASVAARNYAHGFMAEWMRLLRQRTDDEFIPWYTGYWTQQWLSIKVAWYKLGESNDSAVRQLAAYLQEEYQERVLVAATEEVDPNAVIERATTLYVRLLAEQLQGIPRRYDLPMPLFEQHLQSIQAIAAPTAALPSASLYQLVHREPVIDLPAYAALIDRLRSADGGLGSGPSAGRISPVAERAAERLIDRLAISGGASAAAAALGGVAGMVVSLDATGFGAIAHAQEKPELEAQLRASLNEAHDEMWQRLMEDPGSGVLAAINHIEEQIELSLTNMASDTIRLRPAVGAPTTFGEPATDDQGEPAQALTGDEQAGGG